MTLPALLTFLPTSLTLTRGPWAPPMRGLRRWHRTAGLLLALVLASRAFAAESPGGLLWHNDFALDLHRGVQVSPLDGSPPIAITSRSDMDVAVWPDGRVVAVTKPNVYERITALVVMDVGSGRPLHNLVLDGYVRDLAPSPVSRQLVKLRQSDSPGSPFRELVLDLTTQKPRYRIADDDFFAWMPDGRFMLINLKTGLMRIAQLDDPREQVTGRLTLPPGRAMGEFRISPTGTEFMMKLALRQSVPVEADLWIGRLDGSRFEQLTQVRALGSAVWSPDGRHVAYTVNTGSICSGWGCLGGCDQHYTGVALRQVKGFDGTPGSERFEVRNRQGQKQRLGCDVLAWTR